MFSEVRGVPQRGRKSTIRLKSGWNPAKSVRPHLRTTPFARRRSLAHPHRIWSESVSGVLPESFRISMETKRRRQAGDAQKLLGFRESGWEKGVFWKRSLFSEKSGGGGDFFSRDSREFRDSRDFREPPDCGKERRLRPFSRDSREFGDFRDSRDSSNEKTPFVMTPFSGPERMQGQIRWTRAVAYLTLTAEFVWRSVFLASGPHKSHVRVQYFGHNHPFPSSNPLKKTQKSRHYMTPCDTILHDFV